MKEWTKEEIERLVPEGHFENDNYYETGYHLWSVGSFVFNTLLQTRLDLETANKALDVERTNQLGCCQTIARLRDALEKAQWGSRTASQSWLACPECGAYPSNGRDRIMVENGLHQPDCSIGQALKDQP